MTDEQLENEIKRLQDEIEMYQDEIENFSQLSIICKIDRDKVREMKTTYDKVIEKTLHKLDACLEKREKLLKLQIKNLRQK